MTYIPRAFDRAVAIEPESALLNLFFYSNEELSHYAKIDDEMIEERAQCVAELFVREFLKKGSTKKEINSILTKEKLAHFWEKMDDFLHDIHSSKEFPRNSLWDYSAGAYDSDDKVQFGNMCEITARDRLRELCEDIDGFVPALIDDKPFFIPFHLEQINTVSEKCGIVDLTKKTIPSWKTSFLRLFQDSKYQCVIHCNQDGIPELSGNDLMLLPLYLAFLRKEGKIEYNPLRLIAMGEFDKFGKLKAKNADLFFEAFHAGFGCDSFIVFPGSAKNGSAEWNEIALPDLNAEQIEVFFRGKGLFVNTNTEQEGSICSIPPISKDFVGRDEELMNLNKLFEENVLVITGEAGAGKTELAVAYAHRFAERFPQGRFMIPMHGVTSWADAIKIMLEQCDDYEILPEQLGLPTNFNTLPSEEKTTVAYRMLEMRAKKGSILLLLDDLDSIDLISKSGLDVLTNSTGLPSNLHIIATTRLRESSIPSVQKLVEIGNLNDRDAIDLFCKICGNAFSFTEYPMANGKLLLDRIPEDERPKQETIQRIEQEYEAMLNMIHFRKGNAKVLLKDAKCFSKTIENYGKCDIKKEWERIRKGHVTP